jgi:hypothetical protein
MCEVKSMVQSQTKKASKAGLGELKGEFAVTICEFQSSAKLETWEQRQ